MAQGAPPCSPPRRRKGISLLLDVREPELSLPFVGYALLSNAVFGWSRRRVPGVFVPATWIWLLLGVIILFWVLRNVSAYPFSVLAP